MDIKIEEVIKLVKSNDVKNLNIKIIKRNRIRFY